MPILKLFLAFIGNNWKALLLSTIAATTFWFFNALNKDYSTRLNYPLSFKFIQDSVVVVDPLPDVVTIDVSGGGWNLMRKTFLFSAKPVLIALDNPTEIKFITRSSLLPIITSQLGGINVDFVVTDTIFINIEPKKEKTVLVEVDSLAIPLKANYRIVSDIMVNPDSIKVTGPASMIDSLNMTYHLQINENEIDENFREDIEVNLGSNLISSTPEEVNLRFNVKEFNRLTISIPLETTNFPSDSTIYLQDSIILIHFTTEAQNAGRAQPEEFNIAADLTMINKSDSSISPILIAFPSYVSEIKLEPNVLKVVYAKQ